MVSRELIARHCICCDGEHLDKSPAVLMPFVAMRVFGHEPVEITAEWGLRDLRQGMAYTLCNSLQCQNCGALFLDYRFTDEQMAALYYNYRDEIYNRQRLHFEPGYVNAIPNYKKRALYLKDVEKWLSPFLPDRPAVLDWGGGEGVNSLFLECNSMLHIYDISGVELVAGVERLNLEQIQHIRYDLITCSQVLEHVAFPMAFLAQILPFLGSNTLLYLEVPYESLMREYPGSLDLAKIKRHWHEHVNFFTELGMQRLLNRSGLIVIDMMRLPVDIGGRRGEVLGVLAKLA